MDCYTSYTVPALTFLADRSLVETAAAIKVPLPIESDLKLSAVEFYQATALAVQLWKDPVASPFDAGKPDGETWWYQHERHWEHINNRTTDMDDPYERRLALEYDVAMRNRLRHATFGFRIGQFDSELWSDLRLKIFAEKFQIEAAERFGPKSHRAYEVSSFCQSLTLTPFHALAFPLWLLSAVFPCRWPSVAVSFLGRPLPLS
jgi:hypothetical protein